MRYRFFRALGFLVISVLLLAVPLDANGAPGDAEAGFDPNVSATVLCTAVQPDGKILIGGFFTLVDGMNRSFLARLNADGSLDAGFANPNVNNNVYTVAVQPDGKILIGGLFNAVAGVTKWYIARVNANGSLDASFDPSTEAPVHTINVLADGKILLSGQFTEISGFFTVERIGRLHPDGSFDHSFSSSVNGSILSATLQDDGKIIIGGAFTTVSGVSHPYLARLNADGGVDSTFNASAGPSVLSVAVQPDGKVIAGGSFDTSGKHHLARFTASGTDDSTFEPFIDARVWSVALQTDGKILIGGDFTTVNSIQRLRIARLNGDDSLDNTFNPAADGNINCASLQPDGKVLVGGAFANVGGAPRMKFARLANDAATQSLTVSNATRVQWLRGGASPETHQVTFELSVNGGASYTLLGSGTRISGGWERTGLTLPASGQIRARARVAGGGNNGGNGLVETVVAFAALAPEIAVSGNGVNIVDGDSTPAVGDHTDFGSVLTAGDTLVRTFTVANGGTGFLTVGSVTVGGTNAADFTVTATPAASVAPGGSTTFQVTFNPSADGLRSATLSFTNSDANESPFNFSIQGTGVAPEIAVSGNGVNIGDGDSTPAVTDHTDFGSVLIAGGTLVRTFTVANGGTGSLTVGSVTIGGANAADFTVTAAPAASVAPGGSTTFQITFDPGASGLRSATLSFSNNDPNENPFNFSIQGTGLTALENWRQTYFGITANTGNAANRVDYDHDGLLNIFEFAFGFNPTMADSPQLPPWQMSGGNAFFSFATPAGVSGIAYGAEWSATLLPGSWTAIPDTGIAPQHLFSVPVAGQEKMFFRLAVAPDFHTPQPLAFSSAVATFQQAAPYVIANSLLPDVPGWGVFGGVTTDQTGYFNFSTPAYGDVLELALLQNFGSQHWIQQFEIAVTTDPVPNTAGGGNWTTWVPTSLASTSTTLSLVSGTNIRSTGTAATATYTLRGIFPVQGITGLRLTTHPYDYDTGDALPATVGHSSAGNFVLSEFKATADPY